MRDFFAIEENEYKFEWNDVSTVLTMANVLFILLGFWWAPVLGLMNCGLALILNIRSHSHINTYVMQIALIVLNCYFLTM